MIEVILQKVIQTKILAYSDTKTAIPYEFYLNQLIVNMCVFKILMIQAAVDVSVTEVVYIKKYTTTKK